MSAAGDRMNVPSSPLPVFVKVRVQKPLDVPLLHSPVHVPLRSGGASVAVGVSVGMDVGTCVGRIGAWVGGRCKMAITTPTVAVTATSTASAAAGLHLCPGGSSPMTSTMMRSPAHRAGSAQGTWFVPIHCASPGLYRPP